MISAIVAKQGCERILLLVAHDDLRETPRYWIATLGWSWMSLGMVGQTTKMLRNYRALLTDRFIPPWPGFASILKLKPRVRIVVLLNRGPIGTAAVLRLAGADAVIESPFRQAALIDAILPDRDAASVN